MFVLGHLLAVHDQVPAKGSLCGRTSSNCLAGARPSINFLLTVDHPGTVTLAWSDETAFSGATSGF